jgi:hypothetical protein
VCICNRIELTAFTRKISVESRLLGITAMSLFCHLNKVMNVHMSVILFLRIRMILKKWLLATEKYGVFRNICVNRRVCFKFKSIQKKKRYFKKISRFDVFISALKWNLQVQPASFYRVIKKSLCSRKKTTFYFYFMNARTISRSKWCYLLFL